MCPVLPPATPWCTALRGRSLAGGAAAGRRAETDQLLRELAFVFRLTERVRAAVTAGEMPLAVGA
jgi:hypothetical protein